MSDAPNEKSTSTSAKMLYRPIGIASSLLGGLIATQVYKQVYKRISPRHSADAPTPLQSEYPMREVILAVAIQGAVFGAVRAVINRGGARLFERVTGEWPGD